MSSVDRTVAATINVVEMPMWLPGHALKLHEIGKCKINL